MGKNTAKQQQKADARDKSHVSPSIIPEGYRRLFEASIVGKDPAGKVNEFEACPLCGAFLLIAANEPKEGDKPGFVLLEPGRHLPPCPLCQAMRERYPEVASWVARVVGHHNIWCHDPRNDRRAAAQKNGGGA